MPRLSRSGSNRMARCMSPWVASASTSRARRRQDPLPMETVKEGAVSCDQKYGFNKGKTDGLAVQTMRSGIVCECLWWKTYVEHWEHGRLKWFKTMKCWVWQWEFGFEITFFYDFVWGTYPKHIVRSMQYVNQGSWFKSGLINQTLGTHGQTDRTKQRFLFNTTWLCPRIASIDIAKWWQFCGIYCIRIPYIIFLGHTQKHALLCLCETSE